MALTDKTILNTEQPAGTIMAPAGQVLSAGTLAGDNVRNRAGESLGKIEEIMLDMESGRVAYAVLSFGGFLGIGDKLFAIPWSALEMNTAEQEFLLDVEKSTLENAPGFDKDNWPDMADPTWGSSVHAHYGEQPYWNPPSADFTDSGLNPERPAVRTAGAGFAPTIPEASTSNKRGDY